MNTLAHSLDFWSGMALLAAENLPAQILVWMLVLVAAGLLLASSVRTWVVGIAALVLAAIIVGVGLQISSLLVVGTILGVVGLICVLPPSRADLRIVGALFFAAALGVYAYAVGTNNVSAVTHDVISWVVFAILALTTVGSAVAMVSSRNAVYSAIWFALTLLGTGGLFLYQGAQFLGVATVVVYAGAIVVTFLFVIMLAQPGGHAAYDRISWGWFAKPAAGLAAAMLMGAVLYALDGIGHGGVREQVVAAIDDLAVSDEPLPLTSSQVVKATLTGPEARRSVELQLNSTASEVNFSAEEKTRLADAIAKRLPETDSPLKVSFSPALAAPHDVLADSHMAHLGGYLFSRHLIAVEIAGTLLLVALVGAVAMLSPSTAAGRREGDARV
jgi:NADH-quinone oxidoreductase subunit J